MNQPILKSSYGTDTSGNADYSILDFVKEMQTLGIDPKPIFTIAAEEIFNLHWQKVFGYTERMIAQMNEENNEDGIYMWNEIHTILWDRISPSHIIRH